jgi:predicted MFS family arabinose efflux permease
MQAVAQAWLVFEISKSPFLLGLDTFLGQIPIFLFSLVGGVIADRMDRRRLLIVSQVVQLCCAFSLASLVGFGVVKVWHILALSFVVGTAQAFGGPAYQALIPSLVEPEDLPNAIALNSIQFNLARVIGPAVGGIIFTTFGYAWCFSLNGVSYIAVILTLWLLKTKFIPKKTGESMLSSMREGFAFIRERASMEALIILAFVMTFLGVPLVTFLPLIAKDVFHGGPRVFTTMMSVFGGGAVVGALFVASLGNVRKKGQFALVTLSALGVAIAGIAWSQWLVVSYLLIFACGAALTCMFTTISSLVQLITSHEMRGRVMSVYNVAFRGGMPLGSLTTGWLVQNAITTPTMLSINGALLFFVGIWYLVFQRRVAAL